MEEKNNDESQNQYENDLDFNEMKREEEIFDILESNFEKAQNSPNPIEAYKEIIELERSNTKSVEFNFKSNIELAIIYINNNNELEFKNSINLISELYKKIEESDKTKAKDKLCSFIDNFPDIERQIKLYEIIREVFLENKLLNESLEFGFIICDKVLEKKKYNEYNKLLPSLIEDIDDYKENNIAKIIKTKITEIENQISKEDNEDNNENKYKNNYEKKHEINLKKNVVNNNRNNNDINEEIEIQEDIYSKYENDNTEYFDRIENLFTFDNKLCFTDIVSNKMKYYYNSQIKESMLNILIITENGLIADKIVKALSRNNLIVHKAKLNNIKYNYYSFEDEFKGIKSKFKLYSIEGHLYKTELSNNNNTYIKSRISENSNEIERRIRYLSQKADILLLWMNNDSEGENISYEVIYNALPFMNKKKFQQIYRIKFNSLSKEEIRKAFKENNNLEYPNKYLSYEIDIRQIIDLKIGLYIKNILKNENNNNILFNSIQLPILFLILDKNNQMEKSNNNPYYQIYIKLKIKEDLITKI